MKTMTKAILLLGAMALAACSNKNDFTGDDVVDLNQGAGGAGAGAGAGLGAGAGGPSDPRSVAFFQQSVGDRVLFLVDQATLTDAGRSVLSAQASWLAQNPDYNATIEGHADEQGTREYNLALGARRANTARDYLVGQGVAASRLKVVSFGKERPIEICSDEACYSKNRRAVTVLAGGLSG